MHTAEQFTSAFHQVFNSKGEEKFDNLNSILSRLYFSDEVDIEEKFHVLSDISEYGLTLFAKLFQTNDKRIITLCINIIFTFLDNRRTDLAKSLLHIPEIESRFIQCFRDINSIAGHLPDEINFVNQMNYARKVIIILSQGLCSIENIEHFAKNKELIGNYIFSLPVTERLKILNEVFSQGSQLNHIFYLQRGKFKPSTSRGTLKKLLEEKKRIELSVSEFREINISTIYGECRALETVEQKVDYLETIDFGVLHDLDDLENYWRLLDLLAEIAPVNIGCVSRVLLIYANLMKNDIECMKALLTWLIDQRARNIKTNPEVADSLMAIAAYCSYLDASEIIYHILAWHCFENRERDQLAYFTYLTPYILIREDKKQEEESENLDSPFFNRLETFIDSYRGKENTAELLEIFNGRLIANIATDEKIYTPKTSLFQLCQDSKNLNTRKKILQVATKCINYALQNDNPEQQSEDLHERISTMICRMFVVAASDASTEGEIISILERLLDANNYSEMINHLVVDTLNEFNKTCKIAYHIWRYLFSCEEYFERFMNIISKLNIPSETKLSLISPADFGLALIASKLGPRGFTTYFNAIVELTTNLDSRLIRDCFARVNRIGNKDKSNFLGFLLSTDMQILERFSIFLNFLTELIERKALIPDEAIDIIVSARRINPSTKWNYYGTVIDRTKIFPQYILYASLSDFLRHETMQTLATEKIFAMLDIFSKSDNWTKEESKRLVAQLIELLDEDGFNSLLGREELTMSLLLSALQAWKNLQRPFVIHEDEINKIRGVIYKASVYRQNMFNIKLCIKALEVLTELNIPADVLRKLTITETGTYKFDAWFRGNKDFRTNLHNPFLQKIALHYENEPIVAEMAKFKKVDHKTRLICIKRNNVSQDQRLKWTVYRKELAQEILKLPEEERLEYINDALDTNTSLGRFFWMKTKGFFGKKITPNDPVIQSLLKAKKALNAYQERILPAARLSEADHLDSESQENQSLIGNSQL